MVPRGRLELSPKMAQPPVNLDIRRFQQFLLPRTELKDHLKNFIKYRAIFEEDENWQKSGFALNKEYDAGDKRNVLQRHTNTIG